MTHQQVLQSKSIDFQKIQNQYLKALEQTEQKQAQRLLNLKTLVTKSAVTIQRFWKKRQTRYKLLCCNNIKSWWKIVSRKIKIEKRVRERFRTVFYKGVFIEKIRQFVLAKLKKASLKPQLKLKHFNVSKKVIPKIKQSLVYKNSLISQRQYMTNMKLYNELKFQKQWSKYQQSLKLFITNYIKKRWIKQKGVYLDEKGKQRNKQQFIQKQIEKIYDEKFDKLQETQQYLVKSISYLKEVQLGLQNKYSVEMLQMILSMIIRL